MLHLFESEFADLFNFLLTTEFNIIKYLLSEQKDKIDLSIYVSQETNFNKVMGSNSIDIHLMDFNYSH